MKFCVIVLNLAVLMNVILGCDPPSKDILTLEGSECRLWWLYDKPIKDGPTHLFICFNENKYNCAAIYKSGELKNIKRIRDSFFGGDFVYRLTNHGRWEIRNDSLYLQGKGFSTIKKVLDTVFLRPGVFLLDQTNKFNIDNCDCDSLVAQFKGGKVDSISWILNYKEQKLR